MRADLGVVEPSQRVAHRFAIRNVSGSEVSLARLYKSCSCQAIDVATHSLRGGETGWVEVDALVPPRPGPFEAKVVVLSPDEPPRAWLELSLAAIVGTDCLVYADESSHDFGALAADSSASWSFEVVAERIGRGAAPELLRWEVVPAGAFEILSEGEGAARVAEGRVIRSHRFIAVASPPARAGAVEAVATCLAKCGEREVRAPIALRAHVEGPIVPRAPAVFIGVVPASEGAMAELEFDFAAGESEGTLQISTASERLSVESVHRADARVLRIAIRAGAGGWLDESITIRGASHPELVVPVRGLLR